MATLLVIAIGIGLGQWQSRRAEEKQAIGVKLNERLVADRIDGNSLQSTIAIDALEYRTMRLQGRFLAEWPIYLDNRPYQGKAGLQVLMPFRLSGNERVVLVARGWIARNPQDRSLVPALITPPGEVTIEGVTRRTPDRVMQLGEASAVKPGALLQNLNLAGFAAASGLMLQPYLIDQTSDTGDALVRDWPLPSSGIERHRGYAFQWYALTLMAALFFVMTGFRRGQSIADPKPY